MNFLTRTCPIVVLALMLACSSDTPPLTTNVTTFTVSVNPSQIKNLGETSQVLIRAFNSDGTAAYDGTRIFLDVTGGGSLPSEVVLKDGQASTVYVSGSNIGTVTIAASSGTLSATKDIVVTDSFVAADTVTLSLNPNNLGEAGGHVILRVSARDATGNPVAQRPVLFSSDRGHLASNGQPRLTDSSGLVSDILSLTPNDLFPSVTTVNVSAQVDAKQYAGTVSITTNATPVPVFTVSPDAISAGATAFFSATASADSDGDIVQYNWQFGDGGVGHGETVQHIYQDAGTYAVILEVIDELNAQQSTEKAVTIAAVTPNVAPVAAFTSSPTSAIALQPIYFDASTSSDSDGSIVAYHWSFGDSPSTFSGKTVTHVFAGADTYQVILTVTDNLGATNVLIQPLTVTGNALPTASFTATPTSLTRGTSVVFDASASADSDGSISQYTWNFGDGTSQTSSVPALNHVYNQIGSFTAYLTVTDNLGGQGFANTTLTVTDVVNAPPNATFTFTPAAPTTTTPVIFDASTSTDDSGVTSYQWSFGDGRNANGKTVSHRYDQAGTYPVRLTVYDAENASDQNLQNVTVTVSKAPTPKLSVVQLSDFSMILDASATTDDLDDITEMTFQFDGFAPGDIILNIDGGSGPVRQAEIITSETTFTLYFVVTVTDSDGNTAQITASTTFAPDAKTKGSGLRRTLLQ